MPIKLIRQQVTRGANNDWHFGYTNQGEGPVGEVGAENLSAEAVARLWEQVMGPPPVTGLGEEDLVANWDRLELVFTEEIQRRKIGLGGNH